MPTLEDTLTLANNVLSALANLINGEGASTPVPGDSETPLPTYDEQNNTWGIYQDTADGNGIYQGIYQFALDTACSQLTIQSVTGHTTPANTSFPPARYTDCDDVVHDLTSVNDLSGKQVKHFEILSDTAFTVTLTITAGWEHTFDFTTSLFTFAFETSDGQPVGAWQNGVGLVVSDGTQGGGATNSRRLYGTLSFDETTVTGISWDAELTECTQQIIQNVVCARFAYRLNGNRISVTEKGWDFDEFTAGVNTDISTSKIGYSEQADQLELYMRACSDNWSGAGTIRSVTLRGIGENPFI